MAMPTFTYVAKSHEGQRVHGKVDAESLKAAEEQLTEGNAIVYRVEEQHSDRGAKILNALAPIQLEELVGLSQAIASMSDGGMSLKRTFDILYEDTENPSLKRLLGDVSDDLGRGLNLSQALARHTTVFPRYYIAMTSAGESSGNLPEMMRRLAQILIAVESLKARARAALSYPATLFGFTLLSFFIFFAYGSPHLERIYRSLQVTQPLMTRLLLGLGVTLSNNKIALLLLIVGVVYLGYSLPRRPGGRYFADKARLTLPYVGGVYKVLYTARFLRTLSVLYRSGLGLAGSVRLSAATVGNEVMMEELYDLAVRLESGEVLSTVLRSSNYVSRLAVGMIAAGEESGKLEVMLTQVAEVYDVKSENLLQSVRSRIEPTVMLVIGLTVAFLLGVLGWPMLSLVATGP
jgi:type II secretory pathway component PulF